MSWQDRDYNRGGYDSGTPKWAGRTISLFNGSFPLGTWFGTAVRVHILFLIFLAFELVQAWAYTGTIIWTLRYSAMLFVAVLLHEFGHIFGCRAVGGHADQILMWPLGGLASCNPPRRPWAHLVTAAAGPLVNVLLAIGAYAAIQSMTTGEMPVRFDPFGIYTDARFFKTGVIALLADFFAVNYGLLLFNLLMVFFPFDGGRIMQALLWYPMGYVRSMSLATNLGILGAGSVAVYGLLSNQSMLMLVGIFGVSTCIRQRQILRIEGEHGGGEYDPGYYDHRDNKEPGMLARWQATRAARQREARERDETQRNTEVDRILDKVKQHGLHSLSNREKKTLQQATDRQRRAG